MSQPDLNTIQPMQVHSQVVREKQERAQLLTLNQELARQVTQQSRKAAGIGLPSLPVFNKHW